MGAEDFGWMLERCPGAYGVIGNGVEGPYAAGLHSPSYDFNDQIIPVGVAFWITLVRQLLGDGKNV
jgi:hippurate hydrolase